MPNRAAVPRSGWSSAKTTGTAIIRSGGTTAQGQDITITHEDGGVQVNGANVTQADVAATNGVIHVIDAVILPPTE